MGAFPTKSIRVPVRFAVPALFVAGLLLARPAHTAAQEGRPPAARLRPATERPAPGHAPGHAPYLAPGHAPDHAPDTASAPAPRPCKIAFYNVENLFDTTDDPATRDDAFTPRGRRRWSEERCAAKCARIARVVADLSACGGGEAAVVGLAEVETRALAERIAADTSLRSDGYAVVHEESADERGIDVALLYRRDRFTAEGHRAVPVVVPGAPRLATRDILTLWGRLDGRPFFFLAAHWPSRRGGAEASAHRRRAAGAEMRRIVDSVRQADPTVCIVAMGDFNDDPVDASLTECLRARATLPAPGSGDLYNPFCALYRAGRGTLVYRGEWNLFDQIVVCERLADAPAGAPRLAPDPQTGAHATIFRPDYLLLRTGPDRGTPFRTYSGNRYTGGYSDHLPVYIRLE